MKTFLTKNFSIVLAFTLPIVFILALYLSRFLTLTSYDFIYLSCTDGIYFSRYDCEKELAKNFLVRNGRIEINYTNEKEGIAIDDIEYLVSDIDPPYIYLHETKINKSKKISLEEAQSYLLSESAISPDGAEISSGYRDTRANDIVGVFDWGNRNYFSYYLQKYNTNIRLNLVGIESYGSQFTYKFIGWILKEN